MDVGQVVVEKPRHGSMNVVDLVVGRSITHLYGSPAHI